MKKVLPLILFFIIIVLMIQFFGCTHINEFKKFSPAGKKCLFKNFVNPDISKVDIQIDASWVTRNLPISIILQELGVDAFEKRVEERLSGVINADSIVRVLQKDIKEGLVTYLNIIPAESLEDNPDFIVETRLKKISLQSTEYGVYAKIETRALVIKRSNAAIVWQNDEYTNVPVYDTKITLGAPKTVSTAAGVLNAVRLLEMSDDEIRESINDTIEKACTDQVETLREDIAESYTQE